MKAKEKKRTLKATREKSLITCKGSSIKPALVSSQKRWRPEHSGTTYSKCQKKDCQQKNVNPVKQGEIKTFSDEQKLKEFVTIKPAFEDVLKGVLQT